MTTAAASTANASTWMALARPRQWVKNLLLFAAFLFTAGEAWTPEALDTWLPLLARAAVGFVLFSVLSSGGYFLNDARDAEADRAHPRKRARPIARGDIPARVARNAGSLLLVAGVAGSFALGVWFGVAALGYAVGTWAYSRALKDVPLLDTVAVAALFALRAVAGALAIQVQASPWLILCTFAGALFVTATKRQQEQRLLGDDARLHRSTLGHASTGRVALGAGLATAVLYAAYAATAENLPDDGTMLLTVPVVVAGLFRYGWTARMHPSRDADEVLLRDPLLVVVVASFVVLSLGILTRS